METKQFDYVYIVYVGNPEKENDFKIFRVYKEENEAEETTRLLNALSDNNEVAWYLPEPVF